MNGLKIKRIKEEEKPNTCNIHQSLQNDISDFSFYFKRLVELMDGYNWIISRNSTYISWDISEEDYLEEPEISNFRDFHERYKEFSSYRVYDNSIFKKYIDYIIDDWNEIICIKRENGTLKENIEILASLNKEEKEKYLEENIDFIFLNIDGLFWLIFTNDDSSLNLILNALDKHKSFITVDRCNLRDFIDYIEFYSEASI